MKDSALKKITKTRMIFLYCWTALISLLSVIFYLSSKDDIYNLAYTEASTSLKKDLQYMDWNNDNGGIYIRTTRLLKPNELFRKESQEFIKSGNDTLAYVNHSFMMRLVKEHSEDQNGMIGHLHSERPINIKNIPDGWEKSGLDSLQKGAKEISGITTIAEVEYYRLIRPFKSDETCLTCHANVADVGDLLGGISASIPFQKYRELAAKQIRLNIIFTLIVWFWGIISIHFGFSKIKKVTADLYESQTKYMLLAENARDVIWTFDFRKSQYTYVSPSVKQLRGFSAEEACKETIQDSFTKESYQQIMNSIQEIIYKNEYLGNDFRVIVKDTQQLCKDGTVKNVEVVIKLITNNQNEVVELHGVSRDITERIKTQEIISEQNKFLRKTLNSLTYPFVVIDANDFSIKLSNEAAGVNAAGLHCFALSHKNSEPCRNEDHPCPLKIVKNSRKPTQVEHMHYTNDGSKNYFEVHGFPIFDNHGDLCEMIEYSIDITEKKKVQEEIAVMNLKLKELNNTKDKLFSIVAHDLRSPFSGMLGYAEILTEEYDGLSDEEKKFYIANIQSSLRNLLTLIDNLLTWSRLNQSHIKHETAITNINQIVESVFRPLKASANIKNISLFNNCDPDINIVTDPNMLDIVIRNLLSNSIKFTKEGGSICVKTIDVGNAMVIEVEDNGVGMSQEIASSIYEEGALVSTKGTNNEKGTGLGITICKDFVNKSNGSISVKSEVGRGTTVSLTLPKCPPYPKSSETKEVATSIL